MDDMSQLPYGPDAKWYSVPLTRRVEYRVVPLQWYTNQIQQGEPFAMARWSDGEWPCVLGAEGHNTDQHPYSPELRRDLTAVLLERPTYILGLQELVVRTIPVEVDEWLRDHDLSPEWVQGDVFHQASIRDELGPFIEALAARGVILVGPERLGEITIFPVLEHIETPLLNCHEECERVVEETSAAIEKHGSEPVVSISASMSANVIVHRLHGRHPDSTMIDIGSLWEPYAGFAIRRYQQKVVDRLRAAA